MKIIKWFFFTSIAFALIIAIAILIYRWGYYDEMNQIKKDLNKIGGVQVLNIWGHEDITLEEISARIHIKDKGEIVLDNLNRNDNGYPQQVYITEIGGYSFEHISCHCLTGSIGIGPSLNIGTESDFGKILQIPFESPKKVIENYDRIYAVIDSIYKMSNPIHFFPDSNEVNIKSNESFVIFEKQNSKDQDPIFNLLGIEGKFENAKKLPWRSDSCLTANK